MIFLLSYINKSPILELLNFADYCYHLKLFFGFRLFLFELNTIHLKKFRLNQHVLYHNIQTVSVSKKTDIVKTLSSFAHHIPYGSATIAIITSISI